MERSKEILNDLSEKNREELQQELERCREQVVIAMQRYEFVYAAEMNERIELIKKYMRTPSQLKGGK